MGYERFSLYVFVSAFALEAYYLAFTFDFSPSSGTTMDSLVVYVPECSGFFTGYWRIVLGFRQVP